MTTLQAPTDVIALLNFTGGFPTSGDFAPSLVLALAYFLTVPVLVYRFWNPTNRTTILIRPALFCALRLVTLVMRAYMAEKSYSESALLTQLVLISVSYLFLLEPVVALWRRSMQFACPPGTEPIWIKYLTRAMYFCLMAALVTGVLSITQAAALFDEHGRVLIGGTTNLRHASYTLSLVVALITMGMIGLTHFMFDIHSFRTTYLLVPASLVTLVALYRVAQTYTTDYYAVIRSPLAFWISQMTLEYLAYLTFLIVSIPDAFPKLMFGPPSRSWSIAMARELSLSAAEKAAGGEHGDDSHLNTPILGQGYGTRVGEQVPDVPVLNGPVEGELQVMFGGRRFRRSSF